MNAWTKSLAALSLLAGSTLSTVPAGATLATAPTVNILPATPAQDALNALVARPDSPLPTGTKLLSVRIADGLARVNFSHELRDNFAGGDSGETRTVNAILSTLGKFPTIRRVQLLVQGNPVDSLGGLLALSDPLPVLRPTSEPAAAPQNPHRWLHRTPHSAG